MSGRVRLSEVIAEIRSELEEAAAAAHGEALRFDVSEVEVELSIEVANESGGGGGLNVHIFRAEVESKSTSSSGHTITFKMKPAALGGGGVLVSDDSELPAGVRERSGG